MVGFPKHLNTEADYEYVRTHFPAAEWRPHWQALLDEKDAWLMTALLAEGDDGVVDETHKVVEVEGDAGVVQRYQYEFKEDPNCKLFRVGLTANRIRSVLQALPPIGP